MTIPQPTRKISALTTLGLVATVGFTGLIGAAPAQAATQDIVATSEAQKDVWRQDLLNQINSYRASKGLSPFKYSATISGIAQDEATENVRNESLAHSGNFGRDTRSGNRLNGSEISAWYSQISTAKLVEGWKNSPSHNAIMLDPSLKVVGFGVHQVDGELTNTSAPWGFTAVMDGYNYASTADYPADTKTSVTSTPAPAPTYTTKGAIGSKWRALGGSSVLGNPTMNERSVSGGAYQVFKKGTSGTKIMWSSSTGANAIKEYGAIGKKWKAAGYERGYGFPATDERKLSDGGVYQSFKNGKASYKVLWKSGIGSFTVKETGAIGNQWKRAGYERGYGYPITDETPQRDGSVIQKFKKGSKITTVSWKSGRALRVY